MGGSSDSDASTEGDSVNADNSSEMSDREARRCSLIGKANEFGYDEGLNEEEKKELSILEAIESDWATSLAIAGGLVKGVQLFGRAYDAADHLFGDGNTPGDNTPQGDTPGNTTQQPNTQQTPTSEEVTINRQKQAGHVPGTPQNVNRTKQGKPTSSFFGDKSGEKLTRDTYENGSPVPGRPNVKERDFGISTGTGPNGGMQTKVRSHQSPKTGQIHGHPSGPERF